MIANIKWEILELDYNKILILTASWLWYEIIINEIIFSKIQEKKEIELFIYHHRTENSQILFGFLEKEEKEIFENLIKVNWIWWKVAMNILSIWVDRLINAIKSKDNKTIESIKWIGKKWASKIILELKDSDIVKKYSSKNLSEENQEILENKNISKDYSDIINTLVNMWYNKNDIEKTLAKLPEHTESINEIIPFVIRNI